MIYKISNIIFCRMALDVVNMSATPLKNVFKYINMVYIEWAKGTR